MTTTTLRIATRKSPLALWQAEHVRAALLRHYPHFTVELVGMTTQGDRILDTPLSNIGGKGLFVKELEHGLQTGQADIAVHSMKDVPIELPAGLTITVIMTRADPRDAWVSNHYANLAELPMGGRVGTSSPRRTSQLLAQRPDLKVLDLRGNVNTRLKRLDAGEYDAILLAHAGLWRLGFMDRITKVLALEEMLPAIGQGAIGIECRSHDFAIQQLLAPLHDPDTAWRVHAERAVNASLHGGCQAPIAAHATIEGAELRLQALVASLDGSQILRGAIAGHPAQGMVLGKLLADDLLRRGAATILSASHDTIGK